MRLDSGVVAAVESRRRTGTAAASPGGMLPRAPARLRCQVVDGLASMQKWRRARPFCRLFFLLKLHFADSISSAHSTFVSP